MIETRIRVGIEVGGMFTDIALNHSNGTEVAKVRKNYVEPEPAVIDGIVDTQRAQT